MFKKVLLVSIAILVVLTVVTALQPGEFRIVRSATITAPPSTVFTQVNDFHHWQAWSPWVKLDPAMHTAYSGARAGIGASYSWAGNDKVGTGSMTISESIPDTLVRIKLDFLKPFAASNVAEFVFVPTGSGTNVTWSMTGHNNFMVKAVGLFMNMDKMVGDDFEKGLAQLKVVAQASARETPRDTSATH